MTFGRSGLCIGLAAAACLAGCAEDLRRECQATRVGSSFADAKARLDRTGATHTFGMPTCNPGEHLWQTMVGLGAYSCYVTPNAAGTVVKVDFHTGN